MTDFRATHGTSIATSFRSLICKVRFDDAKEILGGSVQLRYLDGRHISFTMSTGPIDIHFHCDDQR